MKRALDKPVPTGGIRRYFFLLYTHFWKLVALNLIFLLFSLPLITLPAALCGMNRVWVKLIGEGNSFLWQDFFGEFKSSFVKSLPLGLLFGGGLFVAWYLLSLSFTNGQTVFGMLFAAIGLFVLLLSLLMGGWAFVLVAMLPLRNRDILKNARALAVLSRSRSAGLILTALMLGFFTVVLLPLSLIPLFLLSVSLAQYTICFLVYDAVDEHILKPYYGQHQSDPAADGNGALRCGNNMPPAPACGAQDKH
jgi:uncharacterized membrane protein YesL